MKTTTLKRTLVQYLMAVTLPQELGILHTSKGENPFISVDKRTGKKTCRINDSELGRFKEETGIELSRAEILSCATMKKLENLVGSKSDKVSMEILTGLILNLTSTLGTVWNNLELVESLDEISDRGMVDPAYVWPKYSNLKLDSAEKEKLEKECECRVIFGRLGVFYRRNYEKKRKLPEIWRRLAKENRRAPVGEGFTHERYGVDSGTGNSIL